MHYTISKHDLMSFAKTCLGICGLCINGEENRIGGTIFLSNDFQ